MRLQLRPGVNAGSTRTANLQLCEKIHSVRVREKKTCSFYLSTLDIFGLEPVESTEFAICWDAAFFSQMISDGQNVLGSLTAQATLLASNLVGLCEWYVYEFQLRKLADYERAIMISTLIIWVGLSQICCY